MDELLRQNMSELVALLTSMLQNGFDKMPTLFAQILSYGAFDAKVGLFFGIACILVAIILLALAIWINDDASAYLIVCGVVLLLIGIPVVLFSIITLWSIANTPELYVFKEVMTYL